MKLLSRAYLLMAQADSSVAIPAAKLCTKRLSSAARTPFRVAAFRHRREWTSDSHDKLRRRDTVFQALECFRDARESFPYDGRDGLGTVGAAREGRRKKVAVNRRAHLVVFQGAAPYGAHCDTAQSRKPGAQGRERAWLC